MIPFLTGPLLGLLGSLLTSGVDLGKKYMDLQTRKVDYAHELALLDKQREIRGVELEAEYRIADLRSLGEMRAASYQQDASYGPTSQWCADILRLFRPIITVALIAVNAAMYFLSGDVEVDGMTFKMKMAFLMMDYLGMAIAWWFGDRKIAAVAKGVK